MRRGVVVTVALLASCVALAEAEAEAEAEVEGEDELTLRLTIEEAVERALADNADLAVERFGPELGEAAVMTSKGPFDWEIGGLLKQDSLVQPPLDLLTGGPRVETDTGNWEFTSHVLFRHGAELDLDFDNARIGTNNEFATFDPAYTSSLTATFKQRRGLPPH